MRTFKMKRYLTILLGMALIAGPIPVALGVEEHPAHDHEQHGHDSHDEHGQAEQGHGHDGHQNNHDTDPHAGHDDHAESVKLSPQEMEEFGIVLAIAQGGQLSATVELSGEVVFNPDSVAHVTPRVPGVAKQVHKSIGDQVRDGDLLAVLDSRALAQAKSEYLALSARQAIAQAHYEREKKLWQQKVSAERVYLEAKQSLEEARIGQQLARRQLYALGLSEAEVTGLAKQPQTELTQYRLTAPISGTVIERHLVRGEVVHEDPQEATFIIADLSRVWVNLAVHQNDLGKVAKGQHVTVWAQPSGYTATGRIAYLSSAIDEATRTATARVAIDNPHGDWRPGMFVIATVEVDAWQAQVWVPETAIQTVDDATVVFVKTDEGFEPRPVTLGRRDGQRLEIVSGLDPGQTYVSANAFTLKAQMGKGDFGHGHAH